jgi:hypothetical protein
VAANQGKNEVAGFLAGKIWLFQKPSGGFPRHLGNAALCRFLILVERNKVAAVEVFHGA